MSSLILHNAIRNKNTNAVQGLISQEIDVNEKETLTGNTPLHLAVFFEEKNRNDIVKLLLSAKADPDLSLLKLFMDAGADVETSFYNSQLPLHLACNRHYTDALNTRSNLVEYLISQGARIYKKDSYGLTPLHYASELTDDALSVIKILVHAGSDVNYKDNFGSTALHSASRIQNLSSVEYLLTVGAHVNETDGNHQTPLHKACSSPFSGDGICLKTIKCLLRNGGDINAFDSQELTPLMVKFRSISKLSTISVHAEIVLSFLLRYSDINVEDFKGNNILTVETNEQNFFSVANIESVKINKIVLKHLAELQALDHPILKNILNTISNDRGNSNYFNNCQQELLLAKETKLRKSWITYFSLLIGSKKKLKNYAGNQDFVDEFKKIDCVKKFPIYGASMVKNVEKGIERRELFDESAVLLCDHWLIFNPNHLITRDVLDCLSTKDLIKFVN